MISQGATSSQPTTNRAQRARFELVAALYKEQLGALIRERRLALDLTQRGLADKIGIQEPQTVSRWERGENAPIDLEAVARALDTTAGEMLGQLSPAAIHDKRLAQDAEQSQLDRIEQSLADVLAALRRLAGEQLPGPPDELLQHPATPTPKTGTARREKNRPAADSQ